jgi:hypothetical protein
MQRLRSLKILANDPGVELSGHLEPSLHLAALLRCDDQAMVR